MQLSDEQKKVVDADNGAFRVLAGPGGSKSTCLVLRYVRLIQEGVSPDDVLSMTFTSQAAKSMRDKSEAEIGVQKMDRVAGWGTFHSIALKFASEERDSFPFKLADFPLATPPVANKIINELARKFDVSWKELPNYISLQKRNRINPTEAIKIAEKEGKNEKLALSFKAYDSRLRSEGVLDFDSLLVEMVNLLEKNPAVASRWQYRFCQSDESQDNSVLEWRLLQLVSKQHGNLLAVGDAAQGIYSFRGAAGDLFMNFGDMFPGAKTLYLSRNFRSSPQIVDLCKKYGSVRELADKFHTTNSDGAAPSVVGYPSAADEAKDVASKVTVSDTAILARTNRMLRSFEDALSTAGVKYKLLGGSGFWGQPEIRSAVAFLTCAIQPHDGAVMAALRSPFHPSKFLKKTEIAATVKKRQEADPKPSAWSILNSLPDKNLGNFVPFLHTLTRYKDVPCQKAVTNILQDLKAFDYYADEATPDSSPRENLSELIRISARFPTLREFLEHIRRVSAASKSKKAVAIGTIHSAKGLEWDRVFLVACNDEVLPHKLGEAKEEANVFFVGISRAARELNLSYHGKPSVFLKDLIAKPEIEEAFA
jgi:DNA helicase-2/ATP-dependent DNA helicase PcrA